MFNKIKIMIYEIVKINPSRDSIDIHIVINDDRTIKISTYKVVKTFNMDEDCYPMKGPLYFFIKELCIGNKYQMMKIIYTINKYRGAWDKYLGV